MLLSIRPKTENHRFAVVFGWYPGPESNRHALRPGILSPLCLTIFITRAGHASRYVTFTLLVQIFKQAGEFFGI